MQLTSSERPRLLIEGTLIEARAQHHWGVPHATWFTLMGVGGGIFLLARLLGRQEQLGLWLGVPAVDVVSFVVIAVGGLILISTLGRPLRVLRALARPATSWISRGALADLVFLAAGTLLVLPGLRLGPTTPFAALPWEATPTNALGYGVEAVAMLSAVVVIYYAGQVLADPNAIPYWHSPAIPLQFVLSSLAISIATVMLLEALAGVPIGRVEPLLLLAFLVLLLAAIAVHLRTGAAEPGKAESVSLLLHGPFRVAFLGGVVGAGTLVPIVLALVGLVAPSARVVTGALALVGTLAAGFALRLLTLRVGIYAPIRATLRLPRR